MLAVADFHPEFYATLATVLPVLLLVTNLAAFFVRGAGTGIRPVLYGEPISVILNTYDSLFGSFLLALFPLRFIFTIAVIVLNVAAEFSAVVVLFLRSASTAADVVIWVGFASSMLWLLTVLLVYLTAMAGLERQSESERRGQASSQPNDEPDTP